MECPSDQVLAELLDGALAASALRDLEIHIDLCAACRLALSHALREQPDGDGVDPGDGPERAGARVGRYQLFDVLGAGGMGVVYAARDPELDRRVAVKVLRDDADASGEGDDRLRGEAQTLARISHPNVLAVYDVGRVGGRRFLAMELVDGPTLRGYLAQRSLDWRERLRLLVGVGRGLAAAHAVGIVHRDVKPDNVLIGADGRPRVSDFGLARSTLVAPGPAGDGTASTTAGTPAYLAPEIRAGTRATAASDQFAFATMCWEILLGARPPAQPTLPRGPRALRRVMLGLRRALAEDPTARWPSMAALVDALESALRPRGRRPLLLALGVSGAAVALVVALSGRHDEEIASACGAIERRTAALWSADHATAVREAFVRTGSRLASSAATSVDAGLRRASADWRAAATIGCRRDPAAFAGGAGPVGCLERRSAQIGALVAVFATADQTVVEQAVVAVAGLTPATTCLDAHDAAEPPRTELWLALARRLEAGFADLNLGRYDRARATAEDVMGEADAAGALGLRAEALLIVAEVERIRGHLDETWRVLGEAIAIADRAGADLPRAEALLELTRLAARDRLRSDEAEQNLRLARGAVARLGDPPSLVVKLAETEADLAMMRKQPSVAIDLLRDALEVVRAANLRWREISVRNDLGTAYMATGQLAEALGEYEQVLAMGMLELPMGDRVVGAAHMNLATSLALLERLDEATTHTERAIEIMRAEGETRMLAQALGNLAAMQAANDQLEIAIATGEESLHVTERVLGGAHLDVALRMSLLGGLQRRGGRLDEAGAILRRAIEIYIATPGDHAPEIADALTNLAELELDAGRASEAVAAAERALRLRRDASAAGAETTSNWIEETERAETALARARLALPRPARTPSSSRR